ncbi:hypothetical protein GCM10010909_04060 [Acidocella aquatica]|uniref:Thioredoxin domain-containing protein n=2 Tax=Acidocella aquatica TaxID=1922313 RepID=A0ABQ6A2T8_9PROT|nr:hypothetical protein GCM10010909_04060 [Acidocella aquatica]
MSRRSIIAAAGLAAAAGWGKFSAAQIAESDLPDAAEVMTRMAPVIAPPMVFTSAKGKRLTLADYAGHPLLVNLWATWCGPCVAELPSFASLAPRLKASDALILPISIDLEGAAAVAPFYTSHGITDLPILLDPNGDNMNVLNTDGIPVTIVINAAGQMVARLDGAANWNTGAVVEFMHGLRGKPPAAKKIFVPA